MEKKEKVLFLKWYDIAALTCILLGQAIYTSTVQFFELYHRNAILLLEESSVNFSSQENWRALIMQSCLLGLAFLYLKWRNFAFSQWKVQISRKALLLGILFFGITSGIMDLYFVAIDSFFPVAVETTASLLERGILERISVSTVIYSLLNGLYEEFYFLGICLSVEEKNKMKYFFLSLLIRFSFHTYQGLQSAFGIGIFMGISYFLLYSKRKDKNLVPYFLSHAMADIFGASVLQFFMN